MIVNILYLLMGIMVGILVKYEMDIRTKKKQVERRMGYLRATAKSKNMKQYDDILMSIRSVNESLSSMNEHNKKKEVQ